MLLLLHGLHQAIVIATTLIFAAFGGLFSSKSGIVNISLEGGMLFSAFAAASVAAISGSAGIGLLVAVIVGLLTALLLGVGAVYLHADQTVTGFAINLLASGVTAVLTLAFFHQLSTPILSGAQIFQPLRWAHPPSFLLPFTRNFLDGFTIFVPLMLLMVLLARLLLYSTTLGTYIRTAGYAPRVLHASGISVRRIRMISMAISGVYVGMAGAYLSIGINSNFVTDMTAGRGYIALAAVIFGRWRPLPVLWACLLFGALTEFAYQMQLVSFKGFSVPNQLVQIVPFVLTILILTRFQGSRGVPTAEGRAFIPG